eukprot:Lithocolla_globosa_v1_NODE_2390_length_2025_cov_7.838579.p2 type:complete len:152 gc:universal NODE_2390_length_2025_cov_7.838579:1294-839(-)
MACIMISSAVMTFAYSSEYSLSKRPNFLKKVATTSTITSRQRKCTPSKPVFASIKVIAWPSRCCARSSSTNGTASSSCAAVIIAVTSIPSDTSSASSCSPGSFPIISVSIACLNFRIVFKRSMFEITKCEEGRDNGSMLSWGLGTQIKKGS